MKLIFLLGFVAVAVAIPSSYYDNKYDSFDITEIIETVRLLKSYAHCFIGDGKCTPEGNDIKELIPEASRTACAKCTENQKILVARCIKAMMNKLPEDWNNLSKLTDPEGKYQKQLEKFIDQYAAA